MKVALYARVSTGSQSVDMQIADLNAVAARSGWIIVATHIDHGISGSKGRDKRPGFDALWTQVTRREVDLVAAWSIDRVGRSVIDLVNFAGQCEGKGVGLYFHKQAIDTTTAVGRLFFQILGAIGQYEREMIRDRVKAGVAARKANGLPVGNHPLDPKLARAAVVAMLEPGASYGKVAKKVGIGKSTVRDCWVAHLAQQEQVAVNRG